MSNCNNNNCGECPNCIVASLQECKQRLVVKMKQLALLFKNLKGDDKNG